MKVKIGWMLAPALMLGLFATGLLPGCSVGNPNDVTTVANGNFSGNYVGANNGALVANNSGNAVTSLTVNQAGNQLQAVDNNGILFKGTIGDILPTGSSSNATTTFTLTGTTTAGQSVTITGNFSASGSTATMTGLWVEPDRYSSFSGVAGITPIIQSVSVTPTSTTLSGSSLSQTFTASGGTAPYLWTLQNSSGTLSANSGVSVTYTRSVVGTNSVTVKDSASSTATATVFQP